MKGLTRAEVVATAREAGFTHIRAESGRLDLDEWKPDRTDAYSYFRIVGGEIITDELSGTWRGCWPLLKVRQEISEPAAIDPAKAPR